MNLGVKEDIDAIVKAVDFAHKNKVDVLIAPEASARGAALLFREVYKKRYPNETAPPAVFINFKVANSAEKLKQHFPVLYKALKEGKKPFIFDSCVHSGRTIDKSRKIIGEVSKKKPLTGVFRFEFIPIGTKINFKGIKDYHCRNYTSVDLGTIDSNFSKSPYGEMRAEKINPELDFLSRIQTLKENLNINEEMRTYRANIKKAAQTVKPKISRKR